MKTHGQDSFSGTRFFSVNFNHLLETNYLSNLGIQDNCVNNV